MTSLSLSKPVFTAGIPFDPSSSDPLCSNRLGYLTRHPYLFSLPVKGKNREALLMPRLLWKEGAEPAASDAIHSILMGEAIYRALLQKSNAEVYHLSRTHSYAELGLTLSTLTRWLTPNRLFYFGEQKFPNLADYYTQWAQIHRSSMALYSHYFDDLFDWILVTETTKYVRLHMDSFKDLPMETILQELSPHAFDVWSLFLKHFKTYEYFDEEMFRHGMKLLLLGGPLFHTENAPFRKQLESLYIQLALSKIPESSPWHLFVRNPRYRKLMLFTAKTVQEIFDCFIPNIPYDVVLAQNIIYAPSIALQNDMAEIRVGEAPVDVLITRSDTARFIKQAFSTIASLPYPQQEYLRFQAEYFLLSFQVNPLLHSSPASIGPQFIRDAFANFLKVPRKPVTSRKSGRTFPKK